MVLIFVSFPVDDNSTMKSVVEYFQEMYGFTIQYTHLPCLQVGNQKKANYLPMEVKGDLLISFILIMRLILLQVV